MTQLVPVHHPLCPKELWREPRAGMTRVECECPIGWPRMSLACCGGPEKKHEMGCPEAEED